MFVSIDHAAIQRHQSILSEELVAVYHISELLEQLYYESIQNTNGLLDIHYILEQKDYIDVHERWIRSRMAILESISEKSVLLSDTVSDLFDESHNAVNVVN